MKNKVKTKEKIIKPNFDKANYQAINEYIQQIDWDKLLRDKNVNEMWEIIKHNTQKAQELFVPNEIINKSKVKYNHIALDDTLHYLLKRKKISF